MSLTDRTEYPAAVDGEFLIVLARAFDDIESALDSQPDLAAAYIIRGNAYLVRRSDGDLRLAVREFGHAINLTPDSPIAYFNRGLVYSEKGERAGACPGEGRG